MLEMLKEKIEEIKENHPQVDNKKLKLQIILVVVAIAIICIAIGIATKNFGKLTITTESMLKDILNSSDLSTVEYNYNSIAQVKNEDKNEIEYYVSYKGVVKAGFDFEKLQIKEKGKKITIIIPEIKITNTSVDTDLKFIFTKEKYDTETTYAEAYNKCCDDLEKKAHKNNTLQTVAKESAKEIIENLTKPFKDTLEEGWSIEIIHSSDIVKEEKKK